MSVIESSNLPNQEELEKELAEYLSKKYGERVKIVSAGFFPQTNQEENDGGKTTKKITQKHGFDFNLRPEELISYLDEYVIKQDEAKTVLATKICTHFNRIRYFEDHPGQAERNIGQIKSNVLLVGPTGVGKTYLIKLIAKRLGVPFIKGDATKFSETGYVGGDVEDLVRDLVKQADGDLERAQYGIIYIDEIDKIAASPNRIGADVSRAGVQRALLKPMEETDVDLKIAHDPISQVEAIEHYRATGKREKRVVNTRNILFIMSGAFGELEEIIQKRVSKQSIGFEGTIASRKPSAGRFLNKVKAEDLIQFGFESEFVGRLPIVAVLQPLNEEDLYAILITPNSSQVIGKKQDFQAYGISILFEDEALREIAVEAFAEQTGARGLLSVMEKKLLPFERKLPSTEIKYLAISAEMVNDPGGTLHTLLNDPESLVENKKLFDDLHRREFEYFQEMILSRFSDYLEKHKVVPTPERIALIAGVCQDEDMEARFVCDLLIRFVEEINRAAVEMSGKCEMHISFTEEAIDRLLNMQPLTSLNVEKVCGDLFKIMEYGFCLLAQKKGMDHVAIPAKGVDNPKNYIDELVENTFKL